MTARTPKPPVDIKTALPLSPGAIALNKANCQMRDDLHQVANTTALLLPDDIHLHDACLFRILKHLPHSGLTPREIIAALRESRAGYMNVASLASRSLADLPIEFCDPDGFAGSGLDPE